MRFASMNSKGRAFETNVVDISETGLAFEVSSNEAPTYALDEGDMLKVEFTPPGAGPIACFATVIRIDSKETWNPDTGNRFATRIAVHFRNLPKIHFQSLQKSLGKLTPHDLIDEGQGRLRAIAIFALAASALCAFGYAMTLPTSFWHSLL